MAQQSNPLHIENSVMSMGQRDLSINQAFHTYREMLADPIISGSLSWIKAVISKSDYNIVPHEKATIQEKKITQAINESLSHMGFRKKATMDNILSMLTYGCSLFEVVLQRQPDGVVGFSNISPIHLTSVQKFEYKDGKLNKLIVNPAENDGLLFINDQQSEINGKKILNFRLDPSSDFPLGRSLLYGCYRPWRSKLIATEYELIGVAKNLSTVVRLSLPLEYINDFMSDPASDNALWVEQALNQVEMLHAGKSSYVMLPSDVNQNGVKLFDVAPLCESTTNFSASDTIERFNKEILFALGTQVLSMPSNSQGSFALASNSTSLLGLWLQNLMACITDEFQKAISLCWEANGQRMDRQPHLEIQDIDEEDMAAFAEGLTKLSTAGFLTPSQSDDEAIRERFNLPKPSQPVTTETKTEEAK